MRWHVFFVWLGGITSLLWGDEVITSTFFHPPLVIKSYALTQAQVEWQGKVVRLLRVVGTRDMSYFLGVDEESLSPLLLPEKVPLKVTNVLSTLYTSLWNQMVSQKRPLAGREKIEYRKSSEFALVLTTDLCPTTRPMSREFFLDLEKASVITGSEVPLLVFFSGKWILRHAHELPWLRERKILYVAGNHTFSHHIFSQSWEREVFIAEITNTERVMLSYGILPSIWFRFPGLRFCPDHIPVLGELGLVAVDTTVWVGERKMPSIGVMLAHANGTQPREVSHMKKFLETNTYALAQHTIFFLDMASYSRRILLPFRKTTQKTFSENR
ncbi:MAG: polysaccharide deacetylase family protein [Brevinematales bacterium]|nr:polysaccharide deacetylase family protein [Brevinematales bacterium]